MHYSKLSDFFFAWLNPALREKYSWCDRIDSSDQGEVQHKDPRTFARQLSYVFAEGKRVLKEAGVLAFSFHHSRPDGWAAIYEAVTLAGLEIVEAHPVHGEIRNSSPKNAAKAPISLDAILVCKKPRHASEAKASSTFALDKALEKSRSLRKAGMHLSIGDLFVVAASQMLVSLSPDPMSFEDVRDILRGLQNQLVAIPEETITPTLVATEVAQHKLFAQVLSGPTEVNGLELRD